MPVTISRQSGADLAARAQLFHALSDGTRLAILELLRGGELCVCELQDALSAAQSRLSFHLKVLRESGLVTDRKEGRWSYYALNPERLAQLTQYTERLGNSADAANPSDCHCAS